MAQTIWIHRLTDAKKAEANGMEYICEHLFQALTQTGKLTKKKGPVPERQRERRHQLPGAILRFVWKELQQWPRQNGERARPGIRKPLLAEPSSR